MTNKPKVWVPLLVLAIGLLTSIVTYEWNQSVSINANTRTSTQKDANYNSVLKEMNRRMDEREDRTQAMFESLQEDMREMRQDIKELIRNTP